LITDLAILNKLEFFSGMVNKWHGLPEDRIISSFSGPQQKKKKDLVG